MKKQILYFVIVILLISACGSTRFNTTSASPVEAEEETPVERYDYTAVQFTQGNVLPPYGVKVNAEIIEITLRIYTSQKDAAGRIADIKNAINAIKASAIKTGTITVGDVSLEQVNSSYSREESVTSNIQNMDSSVVSMKLTTHLSDHENDFIQSVIAFNDFLNSIDLPKTIDIKTMSVEAKLGDLEAYRTQIIDRVYREIDAVQQKYGSSIKFNISGLYNPLKKIQLSNTEFYIYLEPTVTVNEF